MHRDVKEPMYGNFNQARQMSMSFKAQSENNSQFGFPEMMP